jgi:hypothetical protein
MASTALNITFVIIWSSILVLVSLASLPHLIIRCAQFWLVLLWRRSIVIPFFSILISLIALGILFRSLVVSLLDPV